MKTGNTFVTWALAALIAAVTNMTFGVNNKLWLTRFPSIG